MAVLFNEQIYGCIQQSLASTLLYVIAKLSAKQQRQLDFLADFLIGVQYRPGKHNMLPHPLSQQPAAPTDVHPYGNACFSSMVL